MIYVLTQHIELWFARHRGAHRTDQQGTRIVCPNLQSRGFPAQSLGQQRPSRITTCPICKAQLDHAEKILDREEQGEWQWPTAA